MTLLCQVYKSSRKEEMYLYVEKARGLEGVPQALMERFGEPVEVMTLLLRSDSRLARADAQEVLDRIRVTGFYLQMPPSPEALLRREGPGE